jgi:CubicO group peptidase (beta-lactamase class C family)
MFQTWFRSWLLLLAAAVTAAAQTTPGHDLLPKTLAKGQPGVALLVRQGGRDVHAFGVGVRDLRSRAPIDAKTNFRLASVTKQFTAAAIMLLVRDGKLRYETRLPEIFPEFPYGHRVTIRHLLNHTAGLPDYEELMDRSGKQWTPEHQITDSEVFDLLKEAPALKFAPGTKWSYSNSGYVMLGLIVAKVSGTPLDEFLTERIFKPLRMRNTIAYIKGKNSVVDRAFGHVKDGDKLIERDQSSTSATLGDGGVYSNLEDLATWDTALRNHALLSAAEMREALTRVRLADGSTPHWDSGPGDTDPLHGKPVQYGFGWFLDAYQGHERMWHYGDTTGFQTSIQRFPKDDLTIVVLCNRTDIDPTALALQIADRYLKKK